MLCLSLKMAVTILSILIAAIPVAFCYPTAFQNLEESRSEYYATLTFISLLSNQKY